MRARLRLRPRLRLRLRLRLGARAGVGVRVWGSGSGFGFGVVHERERPVLRAARAQPPVEIAQLTRPLDPPRLSRVRIHVFACVTSNLCY